jgi:Fe/S biogenesis protein NfuA
MLTITDLAMEKLRAAMEAEAIEGMALRMAIVGRGPRGFRYAMGFAPADDQRLEDKVLQIDGLQVFVDPNSAENLQGSTLDYVEEGFQEGFKVDNPNPLWRDPIALKVQEVIDTQINPGIAMHGGFVMLLDVKDGIAYIAFGGGCQGCRRVDATLKDGVEVKIREVVPEITQVLDTTDHADGKNPFYSPDAGE